MKKITSITGIALTFLLWMACSSNSQKPSDTESSTRSEEGGSAGSDAMGGDSSDGTMCSDGQRSCDGDMLQGCDGGQWVPLEQCVTIRLCEDTAVLCEVSEAACPAGCQPPACEEDEGKCAGSRVLICNGDRTGFDSGENCGPVCSGPGGQHCYEGSCRRDVCDSAGEFFDGLGDIAECSDDCSEVTYPFSSQ